MAFKVEVFETNEQELRLLGAYDFATAPALHDEIEIAGADDICVYRVIGVTHSVVPLPRCQTTEGWEPRLRIDVKFMRTFDV